MFIHPKIKQKKEKYEKKILWNANSCDRNCRTAKILSLKFPIATTKGSRVAGLSPIVAPFFTETSDFRNTVHSCREGGASRR